MKRVIALVVLGLALVAGSARSDERIIRYVDGVPVYREVLVGDSLPAYGETRIIRSYGAPPVERVYMKRPLSSSQATTVIERGRWVRPTTITINGVTRTVKDPEDLEDLEDLLED